MRTLEEIKTKVPYVKAIDLLNYRTEVTILGTKGSVIFTFADNRGWEHVSFAPYNGKTPTWEQMTMLKDMFWRDDEVCIQIHPKKSEYVNLLDNCLHIWRHNGIELPS